MLCPLHRSTPNARLAGVLGSAARLWMTALVMILLAGCASTPALDPDALRTLSPRVVLDEVPFHPQRDYQCGPAALAMSLNASGVEVGVDRLIEQVYVPGRQGSLQPEMLAATRRHGRIPFLLAPRLDAIFAELDTGRPVVVMQNLSLPAFPLWHFAVANGYDLDAEEILLRTGVTRQDRVPFGRFDATWARSERWAFVALPAGELPRDISANDAVDAVSAFERVQGEAAALPAWQAVAERFADHAMAAFGLANAYHGNGDVDAAVAAWRRATTLDPDLAAAWLNLGLTLAQSETPGSARTPLTRAAQLPGPWQQQAREALASLEGGTP